MTPNENQEQIVITINDSEVVRLTTYEVLLHYWRCGFIAKRPKKGDDIKFHLIDSDGVVRWYPIEVPDNHGF